MWIYDEVSIALLQTGWTGNSELIVYFYVLYFLLVSLLVGDLVSIATLVIMQTESSTSIGDTGSIYMLSGYGMEIVKDK